MTRAEAESNNAKVAAEEALFATLTPEERRRHMQAKALGKKSPIIMDAFKREMPPQPVHIPAPSFEGIPGFQKKPKEPPKPREMNDTERAYSVILENQKQAGSILSWRYEGMRLKWGGCMSYKPDFVVFRMVGGQPVIEMHEIKGPHIWSRDRVRFLGCRNEWPEFSFEMWQRIKGEWKRLY